MNKDLSNNNTCWIIEKPKTSSLEERLKDKIRQKEEDIKDIKIIHALDGQIETPIGIISVLTTKLKGKDRLGNLGVRLGIDRDDYRVPTGIYAIGTPNEESHVLVTANYKLTIDKLRKELDGLNLWILVIDTNGVNVWCAAGKGTFSTEEIIYRINKCKLKKLVSHKQLILPQLGASGVSAHQITKFTGFKAVYGPVYAKDIKQFLKNNCKATEEMRRVNFNLIDRLVVSPLEVVRCIKLLPFVFIFFIFMQLIGGGNSNFIQVLKSGLLNTLPYIIAAIIGTILFPILLPILPFRMFSIKALILGIIWSFVVITYSSVFHYNNSILMNVSNGLLLSSIISYLGMNFTGSTTFTSLSGVKKEILLSMPIIGTSALVGIVLMVVDKFL